MSDRDMFALKLAENGVSYALADEISDVVIDGGSTTAVRLAALGVNPIIAVELARQFASGTYNAPGLIALGFAPVLAFLIASSFSAPLGFLFLVDPDGAYLVDSDGAYLVEAI